MTQYWIHMFVCDSCVTPVMVVNTHEVYVPKLGEGFHDGDTCRDCGKGKIVYVGKVEVRP